MGLLMWLKAKLDGSAVSAEMPHIEDHEKMLGSLDMRDAIAAHMRWVKRVNALIAGDDGEYIDIATVSRDDACTLGKWLHGEGREKFAHYKEYEQLLHSHAEFHLQVGDACICHNRGDIDRATQLARHEVRDLSDQVQLDIVRLYTRHHH